MVITKRDKWLGTQLIKSMMRILFLWYGRKVDQYQVESVRKQSTNLTENNATGGFDCNICLDMVQDPVTTSIVAPVFTNGFITQVYLLKSKITNSLNALCARLKLQNKPQYHSTATVKQKKHLKTKSHTRIQSYHEGLRVLNRIQSSVDIAHMHDRLATAAAAAVAYRYLLVGWHRGVSTDE